MRGSIRASVIRNEPAVFIDRRPNAFVSFVQRARRSPPMVIGFILFTGVLLMAALALLFAIAIVAILGPSLDNLIVAFGLFGWAGYGRLIRGSVLSARQREYVEAARAIGARASRVMARHILPNVIAPVIILSATRFGAALLAGSGLSFIGLGVPIPQPEWGAIIATGRDYIGTAWWITAFPGVLIAIAVLGVNLLGDGLRDVLDPRMRD